jgi:hypothetical protein
MGKFNISPIGSESDYKMEKLSGFDVPTSEKAIEFVLDEVSSLIQLVDFKFNILIFVFGGLNTQQIQEISDKEGTQLIWKGSMIPWYFKPIAFLFAGKCILLKVNDIRILTSLFKMLMPKTFVGAYFINDDLKARLYSEVRKKQCEVVVESFLFDDANAFSITVDGDSSYSETGYYAIVRYSKECNQDVLKVLNKIKLPGHYF